MSAAQERDKQVVEARRMSARNPAAAATATRQQPRSPEELLASMESLIREAKETFVTKEALENLLDLHGQD